MQYQVFTVLSYVSGVIEIAKRKRGEPENKPSWTADFRLIISVGKHIDFREETFSKTPMDKGLLAGVRRGRFSCEALVRDRAEFRRRYPDLQVERIGLDDIMVFMNRGETTCAD